MPSKKKKYNARFPPARIKKIMQSDEEVGKVAQVVPIIISKSLEIFVEQLLSASAEVTRSRNARTLTPTHIKGSILQKPEFAFLREIAQTIPDVNTTGEDEADGGEALTPGVMAASAGPVDFSATSRSNPPANSRVPRGGGHSASSSMASHFHQPGVLNLSNSQSSGAAPAAAASYGPIPGQPRPRGRPRKRPLPEAEVPPMGTPIHPYGSVVPTPSQHWNPGLPSPRKNARVSFAPVPGVMGSGATVTMPSTSALIMPPTATSNHTNSTTITSQHHPTILPPSSSSASSFSSLLALNSVLGMHQPGKHQQLPPAVVPQQQQLRGPRGRPPLASRAATNSDYDSAPDQYDNGHYNDHEEEEEEDDDDDDEDTDSEEDEDGVGGSESDRAVASLGASFLGQLPQRASVLVPNPINQMATTVTTSHEDDDYDNI